jgi:hypothetical protein
MTEPSNGHFYASNRRYLRNFLNLNLNNHLYKPFKVLGYPELWVHIPGDFFRGQKHDDSI